MRTLSEELFLGKSVAIVGPAAHMIGMGGGVEIDSFEIVVKINDSIPYGSNLDYGSRTDCLIVGKEFSENCTRDDVRYIAKRGCRLIISKLHSNCGLSHRFSSVCSGIIPVEFSSYRDRKSMFELGGGKMPNSGVFAIKYVSDRQPSDVKVFGFDLYTSSIVDGKVVFAEPNCGSSSHELKPQAKFIKQASIDGLIRIDNNLCEAVNHVCSDSLSSYLSGKRVAIVGPARYLKGMGLGELFDSYDVVVRVNCSTDIIDEKSFGRRTDILYIANFIVSDFNDEMRENIKRSGVRHVVTKFSDGTKSHSKIKNKLYGSAQITSMGKSAYYSFKKRCNNTPPNTGVCAIMHLLSMPLKSLDIFGFDFYMSGYLDGYQGKSDEELLNPINWGQHNPYYQVVALQKMICGREDVNIHDHMVNVFAKIIERGP